MSNIEQIRQKHILNCTLSELRIRCAFDEQYIKELELKINKLNKDNSALQFKIDESKEFYRRTRDCYEEFE